MIYYLTNTLTKKKTLIVKNTNDLPQDDNHAVVNIIHFNIKDKFFADIITLPSDVDDIKNSIDAIVKYNFQHDDVKIFDDKDKFVAYTTYMKYTGTDT